MQSIEYAEGLPQADYCVVTPYLVPPKGAKKVNVGDGFILDSATRLLGARPAAAFSSRIPLGGRDIERINASRCLIAVGANTLKDDFELAPGFDLGTLARIRVPVILMGVGHYGEAPRTRGLNPASVALFKGMLERFAWMSVRCDASRAYVLQALPDAEAAVMMTACPVVHQVDGIDRDFEREKTVGRLVVTVTDRGAYDNQRWILDHARTRFEAQDAVLALHQDYDNQVLHERAQRLGYRVFRSANHQDFLRLYATADLHFGNRVHAHLKCSSLGIASFCTPHDLRQLYFAESLDFPLVARIDDPALDHYDFDRLRRRRDAARVTMDRFVNRVKQLIYTPSTRDPAQLLRWPASLRGRVRPSVRNQPRFEQAMSAMALGRPELAQHLLPMLERERPKDGRIARLRTMDAVQRFAWPLPRQPYVPRHTAGARQEAIDLVYFHVPLEGWSGPVDMYWALLDRALASVQRHAPAARRVLLTATSTEVPATLRLDAVERFTIDTTQLMYERMRAQHAYLGSRRAGRASVLSDVDVLAARDPTPVFGEDFDVALTWRPIEHDAPFNGGAIFVNAGPGGHAFFAHALRCYDALAAHALLAATVDRDLRDWWGDQFALAGVVGYREFAANRYSGVEVDGVKVRFLPCRTHNRTVGSAGDTRAADEAPFFVHYKGDRKAQLATADAEGASA